MERATKFIDACRRIFAKTGDKFDFPSKELTELLTSQRDQLELIEQYSAINDPELRRFVAREIARHISWLVSQRDRMSSLENKTEKIGYTIGGALFTAGLASLLSATAPAWAPLLIVPGAVALLATVYVTLDISGTKDEIERRRSEIATLLEDVRKIQ